MQNRFLALAAFASAFLLTSSYPPHAHMGATGPLPAPAISLLARPPSAAAGPIISAVELRPAATLLVQPCPVVLVFHGEITTTRPGSVAYTWADSRGRTWPEHHRKFARTGVQAVTHKWKLGRRGKTVDEWVQLKVISPESRVSGKVPVHFTCAK